MSVPDRFVRLALEAVIGEEATSTTGYYGGSYRIDSEHAEDIARAALEPVFNDLHQQLTGVVPHAYECGQYPPPWVDAEVAATWDYPCDCPVRDVLALLNDNPRPEETA